MLTKVTVEAALNAELDEHLGYARHEQYSKVNYRNGYPSKTILAATLLLSKFRIVGHLGAVYSIAYLNCLAVKFRQNEPLINKAIHLALSINIEGHK